MVSYLNTEVGGFFLAAVFEGTAAAGLLFARKNAGSQQEGKCSWLEIRIDLLLRGRFPFFPFSQPLLLVLEWGKIYLRKNNPLFVPFYL
jgi:hypothetical protein